MEASTHVRDETLQNVVMRWNVNKTGMKILVDGESFSGRNSTFPRNLKKFATSFDQVEGFNFRHLFSES